MSDPETDRLKIGVAGALGRMGRAIIANVAARDDAVVAAAFDQPSRRGEPLDGLVLGDLDAALAASEVVIDFSTPTASVALARQAAARGSPALVIGSTGASAEDEAAIAAAAAHVAIVRSGNFSLGVNLLQGLVGQVARVLGPEDWDIEIFEAHHRRKVDAPSGTALMLGQAAAKARGGDLDRLAERGRDTRVGARAKGAIGFSVMRGGGLVGEHSVSFIAEDEVITLSHSARDRSLFARGAIAAALWVRGRPPGLYDMQDVLGFESGHD
ncbi:MAG TPA: 4-hydroxy-tetrahydrodipicolinate reductase [Caulobacteraceae bacterium]|nr:4-hydroxy-tetrahydrodipicolinate reductase [Caulobacteraceae bacterium]